LQVKLRELIASFLQNLSFVIHSFYTAILDLGHRKFLVRRKHMSALPHKNLRFVAALTLCAALLMFSLLFSVPAVAQQATDTPGAETPGPSDTSTICDSTTILLLLLAQRDYGFQSHTLDLASFEFGQFQAEFNAVQAARTQAEVVTTEEAEISGTEEVVEETAEPEQVIEPERLVTLLSAIVAGENPQCALLRSEVEDYLWAQIRAGNPGGGMPTDEETSQ
jgi:hypothetical protein